MKIHVEVANQPSTWGYEEMSDAEMASTAELFCRILEEELNAEVGNVDLDFVVVSGGSPTEISAPSSQVAEQTELCLRRSWERMAGSPEWAEIVGEIELQRPLGQRSPF